MTTDRSLARKAAGVYANTLLEATQAQGNSFAVSGQLAQLLAAIQASTELRTTLADRTIPGQARAGVLKQVFCEYDKSLLAVLGVLVERDDLELLPRVNEAYVYAAEAALDAVFIDVTTVVPLDDELRQAIANKYQAQLGATVLLREHIDASILGGIILSTHGRRIDASVSSQLDNARTVLTTANSGGER